jgi:8-oxo-dGTP diphosphatase
MIQPKVGVGIIIEKNDQVLLLRRKNVLGDGTWSTPGGHLDYGEAPEECAAREAYEETGVHVSDIRFVGVTNDIFEESKKHYITLWMVAKKCEGEPCVNADYEMSEVKWFKWDDLPEQLFIPFRKIVEDQYYKTK